MRWKYPTLTSETRQKLRALLPFLFSWKGRTGRAAFLLFNIALHPLRLAIIHMQAGVYANRMDMGLTDILFYITTLLLLWMSVVIVVKRLHDFGWRGGWALFSVPANALLPGALYLFLIALCAIPGQKDANRFGAPPYTARQLLAEWKLWRLNQKFAAGAIDAETYNKERAAILPPADNSLS